MKQCSSCGLNKALTEFNKRGSGLQPYCAECARLRSKEHYKANKATYLTNVANRKQEKKQWFQEFKSTLKCCRCGESHPATLDFHHSNPLEKEGSISEVIRDWSKTRILEEINKCIILCSNCHRKEHAH